MRAILKEINVTTPGFHTNEVVNLTELGDDYGSIDVLRRSREGLTTLRSLAGMGWTYWATSAQGQSGIHAALVGISHPNRFTSR